MHLIGPKSSHWFFCLFGVFLGVSPIAVRSADAEEQCGVRGGGMGRERGAPAWHSRSLLTAHTSMYLVRGTLKYVQSWFADRLEN